MNQENSKRQGAMKQWFGQLNPQGQILTASLTLLLAGAAVLLGIVVPLHRSEQVLASELNSKRASHAEVVRLAATYRELNVRVQDSASESDLSSRVTSSLQEAGLQISRMQLNPDGSVQLRFEGVDFNQVLAWLALIEAQPGVMLTGLDAHSAATGLVTVSVTLQPSL